MAHADIDMEGYILIGFGDVQTVSLLQSCELYMHPEQHQLKEACGSTWRASTTAGNTSSDFAWDPN